MYDAVITEMPSREFLETWLELVPKELDMQLIAGPHVYRLPDGGLTGFCVIAESHIKVEMVAARRAAFVDIFTCKEFDSGHARELVKALGLDIIAERSILRGLEYLHEVDT
jgi:S-adenosylmethionine decarboxylase